MSFGTHTSTELIAFSVAEHGRARVRISGNSMLPILRDGMIAEVEPFTGRPRRGDVLVYDMGGGAIAHRVLECVSDERFILCGDAVPHQIENIRANAVIGRIAQVWYSDDEAAPTVATWRVKWGGRVMLHTRPLRATCKRFGVLVEQTLAAGRRPRSFSALLQAFRCFSRGEHALGIARLQQVAPATLLATIIRHAATGHLLRFLEAAKAAGITVNESLYQDLRSLRWQCALHADRVVARAAEAKAALDAAGIDCIFLKGAGRILAGEADADVHFSGDIDLLVPFSQVDAAVDALRAKGFTQQASPYERHFYRRYVHHPSPLWKSDAILPIEVHSQLTLPGSVSQRLTFEKLLVHSRVLASRIGQIRVLDDVGAAVNLAYHGRDLRRIRDAGLLASKLAQFTPQESAEFDALIAGEKRDGLRLRCIVKLAKDFAGLPFTLAPAERSYLSWAIFREDLPMIFLKRSPLLDGIYARCLPSYQGLRHVLSVLYAWGYNFMATPLLWLWCIRDRERYGDIMTSSSKPNS